MRSFGRVGKGDSAHQAVRHLSLRSEPAGEQSFAPRGIDQQATAQGLRGRALNDFEPPLAVRIILAGGDSSGEDKFSSCLRGGGGEHRIKLRSIDMPAAAMRVK